MASAACGNTGIPRTGTLWGVRGVQHGLTNQDLEQQVIAKESWQRGPFWACFTLGLLFGTCVCSLGSWHAVRCAVP